VFDEGLNVEPMVSEPWAIHRVSTEDAEYFIDDRGIHLGSRPLDGPRPAIGSVMLTDQRQNETTRVWSSEVGAIDLRHRIEPPDSFAFDFQRQPWDNALARPTLIDWSRELVLSNDGDRASLVVGVQDVVDTEFWEVSNTFVFDLTTGETLRTFRQRARLTPTGTTAVVYPEIFGDPFRIVDIESGQTVGEIEGGQVGFDIAANRLWVTVFNDENSLRLVDLGAPGIERVLPVAGQQILDASPDGQFAAVLLETRSADTERDDGAIVADTERIVSIVEAATGAELAQYATPSFFNLVDFDPTSTYAAYWTESGGGEIVVLNLRTGQADHQIPAQEGAFFRFDRQAPLLHLADRVSGQVALLDLSTGRLLVTERIFPSDTTFVADAIGGELLSFIDDGLSICPVREVGAPSVGGTDSEEVDNGPVIDLADVEVPSEVCGFEDGERIRIEDGLGTHRGMDVGLSPDVETLVDDLNGDGSPDALLVIRCRLGEIAFDGPALWVQGRPPSDLRQYLTTQDIDDLRLEYGAEVRGVTNVDEMLEIEWDAFPLLGDTKWPDYRVRTTLEVLSNGSVAPLSSVVDE
jgi:hypothetical protein